jgi:3-oxoacyl-[acyl-carrier-protein] synthase-3
MAVAFLVAGSADVAVACAETLSKVVHPEVRETWFGLADGGAAVWLERNDTAPDFVVRTSYFSTDGRHADLYTTRGQLPPTVEAVEAMGYRLEGDKEALAALSRTHYAAMLDLLFPSSSLADVNWIVPHQVNRALIDDVLHPRATRATVVWDAREYGNLGGASVLFSMARCLTQRIFAPGDRILLMSVGGGLSAAAQIWEKS